MPDSVPLPSGPTIVLPADPEARKAVLADLQVFYAEQAKAQKVKPRDLAGALLGLAVIAVCTSWVIGGAIGLGVLSYRWVLSFGG